MASLVISQKVRCFVIEFDHPIDDLRFYLRLPPARPGEKRKTNIDTVNTSAASVIWTSSPIKKVFYMANSSILMREDCYFLFFH